MSDDIKQLRFDPQGELTTEEEPTIDERLNDFGDERAWFETKGGFNRFTTSSLLQKAVRRSAEEEAAWAAWEMARSGWGENLWERLNLYAIEDLRAGDEATLLIARYEQLAKERWSMDSWEGKLCAIQAALTAARARSSRESVFANNAFNAIAQERIDARAEERKPRVRFPEEGDLEPGGKYDVVLDKHTSAGSRLGRGREHFTVHGERIGPEEESEVARQWREVSMRLSPIEFTERQIEHTLTPVSDTEKWSEPADLVNRTLTE